MSKIEIFIYMYVHVCTYGWMDGSLVRGICRGFHYFGCPEPPPPYVPFGAGRMAVKRIPQDAQNGDFIIIHTGIEAGAEKMTRWTVDQ